MWFKVYGDRRRELYCPVAGRDRRGSGHKRCVPMSEKQKAYMKFILAEKNERPDRPEWRAFAEWEETFCPPKLSRREMYSFFAGARIDARKRTASFPWVHPASQRPRVG